MEPTNNLMPPLSEITVSRFSSRKALLHLGCWLVFITCELSYLYVVQGYLETWYVYVIFYSLNASLFYGLLWLMSAKFRPAQYALLFRLMSLLLLIATYTSLRFIANHYLDNSQATFSEQLGRWRSFLLATFFRGGSFIYLAIFYWVASHLADYAHRLTNARNAHLQQQLHPHLLFNSLNFIYNQVYQHSPLAAQQVYLLSELMRFSLTPADPDGKVLLDLELEQVRHLIEINRNRFEGALALQTDFPEDRNGYRIIPLILITLTENIFKHGNLTDQQQPAVLTISLKADGKLCYHSRNLKKIRGKTRKEDSIGLQNIRLRLYLAYPHRYHLRINDRPDFFELNLVLPL